MFKKNKEIKKLKEKIEELYLKNRVLTITKNKIIQNMIEYKANEELLSRQINLINQIDKDFINYQTNLVKNFKRFRKEIGATQKQIGSIIDKGGTTISDFENGMRDLSLVQISKILANTYTTYEEFNKKESN